MIYRVDYIKDVAGNNYIGVNVPVDTVQPYLQELKEIIGEEEQEVYTQNQKRRDRDKYHITVINVMDYKNLMKEMGVYKFLQNLELDLDYRIDDLQMMGVGTAQKDGNTAYFIVIRSEKLNSIREKYSLPPHDFHVTIGFKHRDVFGVRKNKIIKPVSPFLKLLKQKYYNENEGFEFVKEIENFDGDKGSPIEPIKIDDFGLTIRCGKNDYYTISLQTNGLWVTAKWQDKQNKPILSTTLISRILKDI